MKKLSAVLLSMLLLLSISQAAFAQQNYLGVMVGGSRYIDGSDSYLFTPGVKLNYNLSDKFSLNGKASVSIDFKNEKGYSIFGQFDARFEILELLMIKAGISVGVDTLYDSSTQNNMGLDLTAGIYVDANLIGSLSVYADAKIALVKILPSPVEWLLGNDSEMQFLGSVGLMYNVLPMLTINGEVGYQAGSIFFTAGAGLTF